MLATESAKEKKWSASDESCLTSLYIIMTWLSWNGDQVFLITYSLYSVKHYCRDNVKWITCTVNETYWDGSKLMQSVLHLKYWKKIALQNTEHKNSKRLGPQFQKVASYIQRCHSQTTFIQQKCFRKYQNQDLLWTGRKRWRKLCRAVLNCIPFLRVIHLKV